MGFIIDITSNKNKGLLLGLSGNVGTYILNVIFHLLSNYCIPIKTKNQ
jgi:hypothetical protein